MIALILAAQAAVQPVQPTEPPTQSSMRQPLPELTPEPKPDGPVLPFALAIDEARKNSPDLAIAVERITLADNQVQRAWATVRPTLTGNGSLTWNSLGSLVTSSAGYSEGSKLSKTASLNFLWNILNFRAFPAISSAYDTVDVARFNETSLRRDILLTVAATYYQGLALKELAGVARKSALATQAHAKDAQARYEAGLVQLSAALRARIDFLRAAQEVSRAQFAYIAAKSQLAAQIDRHDTAFELAAPDVAPQEIRGELKDLLAKALAERPEMAAARVNEQITARLKTDAWAQFLPSFAVSAFAKYTDPAIAYSLPGPNPETNTWAVAVSMTLPLYDGGFRYVALKDADSQMRTAKAQTRSEAVGIEDELRRAQLDLDSARALREEAEAAAIASRENERLVRAQFSAGTASQVEVSDAESALFQSESNVLQQRLSVQIAVLRMAKAVGAFDVESAK